jgi:hypothetical protein
VPDVPAGLLDKVLAYADRPWRVVAFILAVLILGAGYAVWEQRAVIAQHVLRSYVTPTLQLDRFPGVAQKLLADTGADLAILSKVDLAANLFQNVDGRLVGDPAWRPLARPLPIFSEQTPISLGQIGRLIDGQTVCVDVVQHDHLYEDALLGMKRTCGAGVPPVSGVLIGALTLSWRTAPGAASEAVYAAELGRQATRLATW